MLQKFSHPGPNEALLNNAPSLFGVFRGVFSVLSDWKINLRKSHCKPRVICLPRGALELGPQHGTVILANVVKRLYSPRRKGCVRIRESVSNFSFPIRVAPFEVRQQAAFVGRISVKKKSIASQLLCSFSATLCSIYSYGVKCKNGSLLCYVIHPFLQIETPSPNIYCLTSCRIAVVTYETQNNYWHLKCSLFIPKQQFDSLMEKLLSLSIQ